MKTRRQNIDEAYDLVEGKTPPMTPETARAFLAAVEVEQQARWDAERREAYKGSPEHQRREHEARASELRAIRGKLTTSARGQQKRAAALAKKHGEERMDDATYAQFLRDAHQVAAADEVDQALATQERRHRQAAVVSEPPPYGPGSPHSWFLDTAVARGAETGTFAARGADMDPVRVSERLARHAQESRCAVLTPGSAYGLAIRAQRRELVRVEDPDRHRQAAEAEIRALTTGGGILSAAGSEAAAFVPPAFVLKLFATYRGVARSFADQCASEPLPDYGMRVYVPVFSGASSVTEQSEGGAVSEAVPTTALESGEVKSLDGRVIITEQLSERGFTGGYTFDKVLGEQLAQQLHERVERYTLGVAIANGAAVAGQSSYSTAKLYQDLAKGREQLTDTAGTRLRPTHMFTTSDLYSYASRQVDVTSERPIIVPQFVSGCPVATGADGFDSGDLPKWSRFTGTVMPGGVLWFTSDAIPNYGTTSQTQILVSAPAVAILLMESTPVLNVYPQTGAERLEPTVVLREYCSAVTRHASGTASISSAAYLANLV